MPDSPSVKIVRHFLSPACASDTDIHPDLQRTGYIHLACTAFRYPPQSACQRPASRWESHRRGSRDVPLRPTGCNTFLLDCYRGGRPPLPRIHQTPRESLELRDLDRTLPPGCRVLGVQRRYDEASNLHKGGTWPITAGLGSSQLRRNWLGITASGRTTYWSFLQASPTEGW